MKSQHKDNSWAVQVILPTRKFTGFSISASVNKTNKIIRKFGLSTELTM